LIVGPIGSGKTLASILRWEKLIHEQEPSDDGIRHTRTAVIRNTSVELRDTTIKSFEGFFGDQLKMNWGNLTALYEHGDVRAEILFRALDKPGDMKKLLSLEITFAYLNELRELPKEALENVTSRLGRYPSITQGTEATNPCAWADSNACDNEQWMYKKFFEDRPYNHAVFLQPPAILEDGSVNPEAENIENLPYEYYRGFLAGKSKDWIDVMIRVKFIPLQTGKPVYPEYNDQIHCIDAEYIAPPTTPLPLICAADNGRTSAFLIGQEDNMGRIVVFDELVSDDIGSIEFGEMCKAYMQLNYPQYKISTWLDPWASNSRTQLDNRTQFNEWNKLGLKCRLSHTKHPSIMVESVKRKLSTISKGYPTLVISSKCKMLRKALNGGYQYRRINVGGDKYADKPDKDAYSHVANTLEFLVDGTGASINLSGRDSDRRVTIVSNDWSVF